MRREELHVAIEARWPTLPAASTRQLVEAGIDDRLLTEAVRKGVLFRLRRGAYVRNSHWSQLKPWERDDLRIQAHYESTGGTCRYSHVSAARLHACSVWNCGPQFHVTTGYSNSRTSTGPDVKTHLFERAREKALTEEGWIFVRLEWPHLASPADVNWRVLAATARARIQNRPRSA